jgi:small-conductance mechanosensitive channel
MLGESTNVNTVIREHVNTVVQDLLDVHSPYGAMVYGVLFAVGAWLLGRAVGLGFERILEKPRYIATDRTAIRFLAQLSRVLIYVLAFVFYAHVIPGLNKLGFAGLASVGVLSVVLGFAAQNTLGNLIAGISLLLYRPFNLGDRLQVMAPTGLETGVVESLNLGFTVLRTPDDRRVVIPNSYMASQTNVNLSLIDVRTLCNVPIRISHASDVDRARLILLELAKRHPKVLEVVGCPVTVLGSASVTLSLLLWCQNPLVAGGIKNDLLEAAMKRFEHEGIELFSLRSIWNAKTPS